MKPAEWPTCEDADPLLQAWKKKKVRSSPRVQRLLACALCRLRWESLDDVCRRAVEAAEGYADGTVSLAELTAAHAAGTRANRSRFDKQGILYGQSRGVDPGTLLTQKMNWEASEGASRPSQAMPGRATATLELFTIPEPERAPRRRRVANQIRCVIGHPFASVPFDPAWRSSTVTALAAAIYDERAFDRLPILADALEEAGCDEVALLAHCRIDSIHARGCWALDAILGRE